MIRRPPRSTPLYSSAASDVYKRQSVHRVRESDRWTRDTLDWVKWAPWNRYRGDEQADGEVPEGVEVREEPRPETTGRTGDLIIIDTSDKPPRDFHIKYEDVVKHGVTRRCGGCSSYWKGRPKQGHIPKCRERFREILRDDERVRNQATRERVQAESERGTGEASR